MFVAFVSGLFVSILLVDAEGVLVQNCLAVYKVAWWELQLISFQRQILNLVPPPSFVWLDFCLKESNCKLFGWTVIALKCKGQSNCSLVHSIWCRGTTYSRV